MKEILAGIIETIKNNSKKIKKIILITVIVVIVGSGIAVGAIYSYAKSNVNYSETQLKQVAIKKIPGQVVGVKKELDPEDATFEYTFQIKDLENMLQEITLNSKNGAIIDIESDRHNSDNDGHNRLNNLYNNNHERQK